MIAAIKFAVRVIFSAQRTQLRCVLPDLNLTMRKSDYSKSKQACALGLPIATPALTVIDLVTYLNRKRCRHGAANAAMETQAAGIAMNVERASAGHCDRLERAIIALEYALADARSEADDNVGANEIGVSRAQEALQQAGGEVLEVLAALKSQALQAAAASARAWSDRDCVMAESARP
jgi:hypothetical protein